LQAFPAQEYGLLRGQITSLSEMASGDSAYTAVVSIPMTTTYGKRLHLRAGLTAQAEVLTEEKSLLARVFDKTTDVLLNR
jgi:hypothetical protein